jgi:hypothetical protein
MATIKNNRAGHAARLREEIISHMDEYYEMTGDITDNYIQAQIELVLKGIYETDGEENPDTIDPETVEGDYYRESISEYGTVYKDYEDLN